MSEQRGSGATDERGAVFAALSDQTRRRILEMLASQEMSAGAIARRFDITTAAVSQHLRVLRTARLVLARACAQMRMYELRREGFSSVVEWIEEVRGRERAR